MLFLSIGDFEGFGEFIEVKEFVENDARRVTVADNKMPSFHFKKRISYGTTEIAHSVGFYIDDDLKEISCSDDCLIFYFEFDLYF